jgi:WhiB family redox-sensing transcriptional regulator
MKTEQAFTALSEGIKKHGEPVCQTTDPEMWFPDLGGESYEMRVAKKYCGECPVQRECAIYAITANEAYGIWGGLTASQRQDVRVGRSTLAKAMAASESRVKRTKLPKLT